MLEQPRHLRGAEFIDAIVPPVVHARQAALCGAAEGGTTKRKEVTCPKCREIIEKRLLDGKARKR